MEITDLETLQKSSLKLYNKVEEKVDATGEIRTIVSSFLQKENTKDDFIKLFAANIQFLVSDISNSALRVFLMIIENINYNNIFKYDSDFVAFFVENNILSRSSVYGAISELEKKNVILKIGDKERKQFNIIGQKSYIINPQIVGKGSFRDLKKLRQTITRTYDFEKFEMSQEYQVESSYLGLNEVIDNPNDYDVIDVSETSKDNVTNREILIEKKDPAKLDEKKAEPKQIANESLDAKSLELQIELLKQENARLELQNKAKELELEERKMEMGKNK